MDKHLDIATIGMRNARLPFSYCYQIQNETISPKTPHCQLQIEMHLTVKLLKSFIFICPSYSFNSVSFASVSIWFNRACSVYLAIFLFFFSLFHVFFSSSPHSYWFCMSLHLLRRFMGGRRNECALSSSGCLYYFYH